MNLSVFTRVASFYSIDGMTEGQRTVAAAANAPASLEDSVSATITEQKQRLAATLAAIGDTWDGMVTFLYWMQTAHPLPEPKSDTWKQVIIRGETDGTVGMEMIKELLTWNQHATLILSGGVYGREKSIGDIGAIDMFKHLEHDLLLLGYHPDNIKSRVLIDSLSRHTVDQGKILSGLLSSLEAEDVFVVLPLYHLPRFILTVAASLKHIGCQPNLIPLPSGRWQTHHPRKGPHLSQSNEGKTFRYDQLFAQPPVPSLFAGKYDCGEVDKIVRQAQAGQTLSFRSFLDWYSLT